MSSIPVIHSWMLTHYARRRHQQQQQQQTTQSTINNEYRWSYLDASQTSLKMIITPALQLIILSSEQCIEELLGNYTSRQHVYSMHMLV
jgi:hypothetical protein